MESMLIFCENMCYFSPIFKDFYFKNFYMRKMIVCFKCAPLLIRIHKKVRFQSLATLDFDDLHTQYIFRYRSVRLLPHNLKLPSDHISAKDYKPLIKRSTYCKSISFNVCYAKPN